MGKENIVCGKVVIREIIKSGFEIDKLYISKKINTSSVEDIILHAKEKNVDIKFVYENDMKNICDTKVNQGIAIKIRGYKYYKFNECLEELKKEKFPIILILDSIHDPGNLGAILRSAECMGIKNVIIPQKRSVGLTDVVWKSSMGAIAHLNICRVNNLLNVISKLKQESFRVVATDLNSSRNINEYDYKFPLALIIGNEHYGVDEKLINQCDIKIKIPMFGKVQSLNASVASGIVMYEIKNMQRR